MYLYMSVPLPQEQFEDRRQQPDGLLIFESALPEEYIDDVTGLPNRKALNAGLKICESKYPENFAVAFIDLDGFKEDVNDAHGHTEGDAYLKFAHGVMDESLRASDLSALVTRSGGDEFVVLLPGVHNDTDLTSILVRLQTNLAELGVNNSIGGKVHEGESTSELLKKADERMYENKIRQKIEAATPEQLAAYTEIGRIAATYNLSLRNASAIVKHLDNKAA